MVKVGFLFPGQGAQYVGMGKDFYEQSPVAKKIYETASHIIKKDLTELCFNGPEDVLTRTVNNQVAIFTTSIAILETLKEAYPDLKPTLNCGLSLGEYSALVSSGSMNFETALRVVYERGLLMEKAASDQPGSMVSVIGLDQDACSQIARDCIVDIANFNSPEQIVLSGKKESVVLARDLALAKGAKKAIVLNVSGAFHSRLMESAARGMRTVLDPVEVHVPSSGFIPNVKAAYETDPSAIKAGLISQVSNSVKWTQSVQFASGNGIKKYLEIGPGKVLKGLLRRIDKELSVESIGSFDSIASLKDLIATKE
jgi:[acyl-carrier-protein] S-malonyltransferase